MPSVGALPLPTILPRPIDGLTARVAIQHLLGRPCEGNAVERLNNAILGVGVSIHLGGQPESLVVVGGLGDGRLATSQQLPLRRHVQPCHEVRATAFVCL